MLDFTASDHSTKFPPVSSVATPTASASLPVVGGEVDVPPWDYYDPDLDDESYWAATAPVVDDDEDEETPPPKMTWVH